MMSGDSPTIAVDQVDGSGPPRSVPLASSSTDDAGPRSMPAAGRVRGVNRAGDGQLRAAGEVGRPQDRPGHHAATRGEQAPPIGRCRADAGRPGRGAIAAPALNTMSAASAVG